MRRKKPLEQYEATEAQDLIHLLQAARPPSDMQAPASFRVKVLSQTARRRARSWWFAGLPTTFSPALGTALAAGLLLSLGVNAWFGTHMWERPAPGSPQTARVGQEAGDVSFNASTFQAAIQSQTALGALVAAHSPLEDQGVTFGFAHTPTTRSYLIGVLYVEALAALRSGTMDVAAQRLAALEQALTHEQAPASLTTYTGTLHHVVERSQATDGALDALLAPFEVLYADYAVRQRGDRLPLFRLGTWVGDMSLAAAAGDKAALRRGNVTGYFISAMQQLQAPKGVLQALGRIKQLLEQPVLTDQEVKEVLKLLKKTHSMLG